MQVDFKYPAYLLPALSDKRKFVSIAAGRRSGKTHNAMQWLLEMALVTKDARCLWVDTTQRNITEYADLLVKPLLGEAWGLCKYDRQGHKLTLPNGSYIHLRSAERPENMEGFAYEYAVCNEAGIIFKKPELWQNTLLPMLKAAQVKLVGTPKGLNYFYDLSRMADKDPENWGAYQFSIYDSPFWDKREIQILKAQADPAVWEQEYLGKFVANVSFSVVNRALSESWRDQFDRQYTLEHDWIQHQLGLEGYWFACFDGGMQSSGMACTLGYHVDRYNRDILVAEIVNQHKAEDMREIARRLIDFCEHHNINHRDIKAYGDPALATYKDDEQINEELGLKVNLLDTLRISTNTELKGLYSNRKTARLGALRRDMAQLCDDSKPRIIVLRKDFAEFHPKKFGCYYLFQGLWEGEYKFEEKDGRILSDLEQNHPIVDVCDSFTYYLLETRPLKSSTQKIIIDDRTARLASSGW